MSALDFVVDAINRHWRAYGARPRCVQLSEVHMRAICDDVGALQVMNLEHWVPTIRGVPIERLPNVVPRLIRADGAVEEM